jgi:GxxExxY protein
MSFAPIPERTERLATAVMDAAFEVHRNLGPGLLESVCESCVAYELTKRQIPLAAQLCLPVVYDNLRLDAGLRIDLLVDDLIIVELKAVEKLIPLHEAQLLTYLKLTDKRLGLLINFNSVLLKDGFKRIVR